MDFNRRNIFIKCDNGQLSQKWKLILEQRQRTTMHTFLFHNKRSQRARLVWPCAFVLGCAFVSAVLAQSVSTDDAPARTTSRFALQADSISSDASSIGKWEKPAPVLL